MTKNDDHVRPLSCFRFWAAQKLQVDWRGWWMVPPMQWAWKSACWSATSRLLVRSGQQQPDCSKPTNSKTVFKTPGPDCFTLRPRPTQARHQWWCSLDQTNEWMSGYIIYNIDCLVLGRLVACLVDWLCLRSCCARKKIINLMRAGPKEPPQSLLFW